MWAAPREPGPAPGVRAGHVEIAQRGAFHAMARRGVGEHPLGRQLGAPVGVGRGGRRVLADRHRRRGAVDGGGGREHKAPDPGLDAAPDQVGARNGIVAVVVQRPGDGVGYRGAAGEVHHGLDAVFADDTGRRRRAADIALHERRVGRNRRAVACGEIVEHDHRVAGIAQRERHVAAHITGASGDQKRAPAGHSPSLAAPVAVRAARRADPEPGRARERDPGWTAGTGAAATLDGPCRPAHACGNSPAWPGRKAVRPHIGARGTWSVSGKKVIWTLTCAIAHGSGPPAAPVVNPRATPWKTPRSACERLKSTPSLLRRSCLACAGFIERSARAGHAATAGAGGSMGLVPQGDRPQGRSTVRAASPAVQTGRLPVPVHGVNDDSDRRCGQAGCPHTAIPPVGPQPSGRSCTRRRHAPHTRMPLNSRKEGCRLSPCIRMGFGNFFATTCAPWQRGAQGGASRCEPRDRAAPRLRPRAPGSRRHPLGPGAAVLRRAARIDAVQATAAGNVR